MLVNYLLIPLSNHLKFYVHLGSIIEGNYNRKRIQKEWHGFKIQKYVPQHTIFIEIIVK